MENQKITKEIINNIPQNLFLNSKTRKKMKLFYNELLKVINEKSKKKENPKNIKNDLFSLLKKIFPDIYHYFYTNKNYQNLEIFIYCLCNQLENQISKIVEGYRQFDLSLNELDINLMMNSQNKANNFIQSFLASFYDFFEDELVINYDDIINSIIEANNTPKQKNNKNDKRDEINNSFLITIIKVINLINKLNIANDEFSHIFTEGMNTPNDIYSSLTDMGYLILKIIESVITLANFAISNNKNMDKNLFTFIKLSYINIIPCFSDFFTHIILNYNLKRTFNIILKKEEFISLFTKLSSIKIIRHRLLEILPIISQIFKPEKEAFCIKTINKNKIYEKIISYILKDLNNKRYSNTKEILSDIKSIIIFFINNNNFFSKIKENISPIFIQISNLFLKSDKNFLNSFSSFFEEINTSNNTLPNENKFKIYNLIISIIQEVPYISKVAAPAFLKNFENNLEFYQEMKGKVNFLNSFVSYLYNCQPETIDCFFDLLINLFNNFQYIPDMELLNLMNSIICFTEAANIKALVNNLKKLNNAINLRIKSNAILNQINSKVSQNKNKKNSKESNTEKLEEFESMNLFKGINQNYIDIIYNILNDNISLVTQKKTQNLYKPELLYYTFDYIQEIIKTESIYKYFSSKKFVSLFHSLVSIPYYKPIAYKIIEVVLKANMDKEDNEANIKLILNRYTSFSTADVEEKNEKEILFVEMNKIKELILMYRTLKITFISETLNEKSLLKTNLNEKIIEFILTYIDYINEIKAIIYKVYNYQFHLYLKEYLEILFELITISNENVINKQHDTCPKLNLENFNKIIYKTLQFFKSYPKLNSKENQKEINKSLINNINNDKKTSKNEQTKNDIKKSDNQEINKNEININNKNIKNVNNENKNKMNNIDNNNNFNYSLDIIKYFIDKSLNIPYEKNQKENFHYNKFDDYYINKYKIDKSIFKNNKYKNILSNLIIQSPLVLVTLLKYLYKLDMHLDIFLNLIYLLCIANENNIIFLLRQNILIILLDISETSIKYNYIILKILNCCFKYLTKEELRHVFEHLIKMFNINNHYFTKDILQSLNNTLQIIIGADYEFTKGIILTNYEVKQPNIYNIININNINLSCFNDSIIKMKQEIYFYTTEIKDIKLTLLKLENEFFGENKKKQYLEISLFNYDLLVKENDSNKDNDIILNVKDFIIMDDINTFTYNFNKNENKLSVGVNQKNIFSYEYSFDFPNSEEKKNNKNNTSNSILITIGYPLEEIKNYPEDNFLLFHHIKLLSFNIKVENSNKEKQNIYKMKIEKIKLINKPYNKLTNFQLDDDTTLISKYNSYETVKINTIFYQNNLNAFFYNNIFFITSYLSHSFHYTFRLEKYLFILLNNLNLDQELFKLIMNLLCSYFMLNRDYLNNFLTKEEIASSLYFILYRYAHYIDKSIVEITFTSLFCYDKLNSTIVTDIFLDYQIFGKLNNQTKNELLNLIDRKLLLIDDYNLEILLLEKLCNLLILCDNDTSKNNSNDNKANINMPLDSNDEKYVDESIIEIISKLIFKNSKIQVFIDKVIDKFYMIFAFHVFVKEHIIQYDKGRPKDTHQIISSFFKKMFVNENVSKIKNIFIKIFNNKINFEKFIKDKLINLCQLYNPQNNNYFMYLEGGVNDVFLQDKKNNKNKQRSKSFMIFKKDENKEDINSVAPRKPKRKKTLADDNNYKGDDSFAIVGKINYNSFKIILSNNDEITCDGECQFCKFIKIIVLDLFKREKKFNIFEKYMLNNYSETYLINNNLQYNLSFSYYLMKKEGISRIKKNFELKVDKIINFEIDRSQDELKNKAKKMDYQKLFSFYKGKKFSQNLINMFNLQQIFDVELVTECLDENDSFKNCYNCLLFEGLDYINSVIILAKEKIYILTNVNVSNELILYNAIIPIPRTFWVIDNYADLLSSQCKYLQMIDYSKESSLLRSKSINNENKNIQNNEIFEKAKKGFQIYSFNYNEINELHKKRFLHQNNAIEMFLKNGKNYYLAFNVDLRDIIVGKIIQNIIEQKNNRNKNYLINNAISYNENEVNYNHQSSNGSLTNTDVTSNTNNNVSSYEINNNTSSSIKNENMIFIRNINLFIEQDKNQNKNSIRHKIIHSKGKKNFSKITDTKEILDLALEKWSNGFLNTYSYIMLLNTLSGRTYNNLAQYPIYPWILKDYSSNEIDLNESKTYRDFSYPIYAQDEETRENLKIKYESFEDADVKYHCGSHYSNSGFVCYYLIRVKPYSNISAEIQGNCFDTPDRLFFNINKFYLVQEKYQELIPEIFNIPELYININNYTFGKTSDHCLINDVQLPPWALNSPRLFSKMNKKALESQYVSQHINDWIDLIFGFKRAGTEAEKSFNVLKDFFNYFDPKKDEEDVVEGKIIELCEMGIDPVQLFFKAHPKRERHQINKAFFGRSVLMTFFGANEEENYQIKNFHNSSKIKEIYSYYENKNGILSHGEGGLSSFRMIYDNDTKFLKGKSNESKEGNIYFIVGEKKSLIPPSYKNFIEWGTKNIFSILKPFRNKKYTFKITHMKKFCITCIKLSSDGKNIVLGYDNGVIEKYKLKKINNCFIEEEITILKNTENNNNISNSGEKNQNNDTQSNNNNSNSNNTIKKYQTKGKNILKSMFFFKKSKNKEKEKDEKYNNISSASFHNSLSSNINNLNLNKKNSDSIQTKMIVKSHKIFNPQLSMSSSNILNYETFLLNNDNCKFIQYNSQSYEISPNSNSKDNIEGYYFHSKSTSELKHLSKKNSQNLEYAQKGYIIFLLNASYNILNEIYLIDICDSFSFMIVVDKFNKIYLYDFISFKLLKYIDISNMFTNQIKYSNICPYTGDFIVSSSKNVVLMNINGIFLSQMSEVHSKINSCCISVIPMTESDLFLFTGHKDGTLIVSKLINNCGNHEIKIQENNKNSTIINQLYHEGYNNLKTNYRKYLDNNNLSLNFDIVIKIKCSENPIRFIKLTEDLTEIICIDNKNKIIYLNYEKYFINRKENKHKKNIKICPMCKSAISSSKILCHLCGKKLCANCKIEKILPEYSFKTPKAICEDCSQLLDSTNKMLYDF